MNKFREGQVFVKDLIEGYNDKDLFNIIGKCVNTDNGVDRNIIHGKDGKIIMLAEDTKLIKADIPVIVIEGGDGVGKNTQYKLLLEKFRNPIKKDYPNYELNSGKVVYDYLHGGFAKTGDILKDTFRAACLYSVNRFEDIYMNKEEWPQDPYTAMVCDRYTTANLLHMTAFMMQEGVSQTEILKQVMKIIQFEEDLGIKQPDFVIRLYSLGDLGKDNMKNRDMLDDHEKNDRHRHYVNFAGKWLSDVLSNTWYSIQVDEFSTIHEKYVMKSVEAISKEIETATRTMFPEYMI